MGQLFLNLMKKIGKTKMESCCKQDLVNPKLLLVLFLQNHKKPSKNPSANALTQKGSFKHGKKAMIPNQPARAAVTIVTKTDFVMPLGTKTAQSYQH